MHCVYLSSGGTRIHHRRGANPPGGAPTYDFAKISEKLHGIEKILGSRGVRARGAPLRSATGMLQVPFVFEFESEWPSGNSATKQSLNYHSSDLVKSVEWPNSN